MQTIMAYTNLLYHIVFRTHASQPTITEAHEQELYKYIWGFVKDKNCVLHRINGMPDHVHMLVEIHPSLAVSDFMCMLKISASNYMKSHREWFPMFGGWGKSYCAISYSGKEKETVRHYIMTQKEHHRHVAFADELRQLLTDNGIAFDEAYYLKE